MIVHIPPLLKKKNKTKLPWAFHMLLPDGVWAPAHSFLQPFPQLIQISNTSSFALWGIIQGLVRPGRILSSLQCADLCSVLPWLAFV